MRLPTEIVDPALRPVWDRARGSLRRGSRTVMLREMTPATRHALGLLLGRAVTGDVRLVLAELDALLAERAGCSLLEVVESVTGPLPDRDAQLAAREAPLAVLAEVDPAWAAAVRRSGLLTRLPDPVGTARAAVRVLAGLPGPSRLRTELAATVLGDAHALDDGRPLASLVLRGLGEGELPPDRRAAWERAGVLADTVSTTVLTLGLRVPGMLDTAAAQGDPVHLTPWHLRRTEVGAHRGPVLVVENPAVLEAFAHRYGGRFSVVCTAGWPASVALDLLDRLTAPLRYHGDLDWRGVEICAWLVQRCGVVPWRMAAADYRRAASGGQPLTGREVGTPWDPELAAVMKERGVAVHEEQVLDELLDTWPEVVGGGAN